MRKSHEVSSLYHSALRNMVRWIMEPNLEKWDPELGSHKSIQSCRSVTKSCLILRPNGLRHARLPCPSLSPRVCSNSCPLSKWCYLSISSSVIPFFSFPQSFPASGSFLMSQLFTSVAKVLELQLQHQSFCFSWSDGTRCCDLSFFFFFECWVLSQLFHSPLSPLSKGSLVPLQFLPLEWYHLHIQRRKWHPTPVLLPGKSHGRRSLVRCSPWGHKESDMTKRFHFSLSCIGEGNGNPLQCSCPENPRDRGAWWAAIYGVAQSRTWLKWLSSSSICISEVVDISPSNLDSSLWFIQLGISHDVLCI